MSTENRYIILYDTYGEGLELIDGLDLDPIKESELPDSICVAAEEILGQGGISIKEAKIDDFLVNQIVICKLSSRNSVSDLIRSTLVDHQKAENDSEYKEYLRLKEKYGNVK